MLKIPAFGNTRNVNYDYLNYEQHKFTLKFLDHDLELDYWRHKNDLLRGDVHNGLIQSLILWSLMALAFYLTNPEAYSILAITMVLLVYPIFISMIAFLKKERFKMHAHSIALISNIVAAILVLYVGFIIPNKLYPVLVALIFVIFFGVYLYRFTKIATLIIVVAYCAAYLALFLNFSKYEAIDFTIAVMYCIFIPMFAITASHASEKKERELFVYQKLVSNERDRSDKLLLNILPNKIANRLKEGERVIADNYDQVTVLFADIVGFTRLSNKMSPDKLVYLLNHIFSAIDTSAKALQVEKIKTIGDAYMVVGGLNTDDSGVENIAKLALEIQAFFKKDPMVHQFDLNIRIGFHTGAVTAGVIGLTKFSFDLWGDTVNIASRMESHGEPGKIHLSEQSKHLLEGQFNFEARPDIDIKGKGVMSTFFLTST